VIEPDFSYEMEALSGPGWRLRGDAFRFVDPIFSSGVDVALNAASFAHEAIVESLHGTDEAEAFAAYGQKLNAGVDVWYETTRLFYELQQLFGRFAMDRRYAEDVARSLQGNPYNPVNQERARRLLAAMQHDYEQIMQDPANLLRPGALTPASVAGHDGS
jgi:FADH2 O2-dependent halogenase